MFENLPNNVEEPYRFTGDVSTSFIVQAEQINLLTA